MIRHTGRLSDMGADIVEINRLNDLYRDSRLITMSYVAVDNVVRVSYRFFEDGDGFLEKDEEEKLLFMQPGLHLCFNMDSKQKRSKGGLYMLPKELFINGKDYNRRQFGSHSRKPKYVEMTNRFLAAANSDEDLKSVEQPFRSFICAARLHRRFHEYLRLVAPEVEKFLDSEAVIDDQPTDISIVMFDREALQKALLDAVDNQKYELAAYYRNRIAGKI